jgi:hypothetical protein
MKKTDTSLEAFASIRPITGFREKRIFEELKKHGDVGLTGTEIELRLVMRDASSRINSLVKRGWLVRTPEKRRNPPKEPGRRGALARILIVPKHVRDGGTPLPKRSERSASVLLDAALKKNAILTETLAWYANEKNQVKACPPPLRGWVPAYQRAQDALLAEAELGFPYLDEDKATAPRPTKPKSSIPALPRFTVQTDAHPLGIAWLMLGKFCVAKYTDSENGNGNVSANAVAFHLNRMFGLTEKVR